MGTIPCGKRVLQLLRDREDGVFQSTMLKLEKRWQVRKRLRVGLRT